MSDKIPPNQGTPGGNRKSLLRGAWADISGLTAIHGGSSYVIYGSPGNNDYNYDDAEGWAERITYHGSTEFAPYKNPTYSSTNDTEVKFKSYSSGLTQLRRKSEGSVSSATGTSGRVIQITNGRTSGEVYTQHYQNIASPFVGALCSAMPGSSWYCSWYARKSNSAPSNTGQVRQTMYIFGTQYANSQYSYTFSGNSGGNATNSSPASPDTGHTFYYAQNILTTSWTKYDMAFKLGSAYTTTGVLTMRLDNDDGRWDGSNGSQIYIDRITLHPFNIGLEAVGGDGGSNPDTLDDYSFGNYAGV